MPYRQDLDTLEWIEVDAAGNPVGDAPASAPQERGPIVVGTPKPREVKEPKTSYRPMTPAEIAAAGLPQGTVAQVSSQGGISVISKPGDGNGGKRSATEIELEAKEASGQKRANTIRSILGEVRNLYTKDIEGQPASRLFGLTEKIDSLPRNERFRAAANNILPLIRPLVAQTAKEGDSDKEMEVFLSYIPHNDDSDITIEQKFKQLEMLIGGMVDGKAPSQALSEGQQSEDELDKVAAVGNTNTNGLPPVNQGGNDRSTPWDRTDGQRVATGETRIVEHPEVASLAYSLVRSGAGFATVQAALAKKNAPITMAQFAEAQKRLKANPGVNPFVSRTEVPVTALQRAAASPLGTAGVGMANGFTLGGLDEIVGGINSTLNGTSYEDERDIAQGAKEAGANLNWKSSLAGNLLGGLTGGALGGLALGGTKAGAAVSTLPGSLTAGAGYGAANGALEDNDSRMGGALLGGILGLGGGAAGRFLGAPVAERLSRRFSDTGNLSPLEQAIPDSVQSNLQDASRLGVPYSLADADPKLRALAGSASRKSPNARALAEEVFGNRARGQSDRIVDAIDQRLASPVDINAVASDIIKGGNIEAGPYYARAKAQPALNDPVVNSILNTATGKDALKRAYRLASDERRDPTELGFILDESSGEVRINDAGRFTTDRGPEPISERSAIQGRGKRAPTDLVTFARQLGGLRDQAGELSHSGFTNRGRKGVPFAGQDEKFGPLISERGKTLDELGEAAWEAGYFSERPTTNQLLDALRDTHDDVRRTFHPQDEAVVADYFNKQQQRTDWQNAEGRLRDISEPAGPAPFAPPEAYGKEVPLPTYQSLHYVRQGFDDILDGYRDPVTGKVNLDNQGRGVASLRRDLDSKLKENPDFRQGDAIYSKAARRRDALQDGFGVLPRNNVPFRDFDARLAQAKAYDDDFTQSADRLIPEMQAGYATNLADQADKLRYSANPWEAIYGAPVQQKKIDALFPEGAPDFARQYALEQDMAKTAYETIGGSPTAGRTAADALFEGPAGALLDGGVQMATGGGLSVAGVAKSTARPLVDAWRLGVGQKRADEIAPALFDTDTDLALSYVTEALAKRAALKNRKSGFQSRGALLGALLSPALLPSQ